MDEATANPRMIAALYVIKDGHYFNLPGVAPWDEDRNAMLYDGPYPIVAHPPCARWCKLAGLVQATCGHKVGDDGGLFANALASVRKWGGVLEHPAYSKAWPVFGLQKPSNKGGWTEPDQFGGSSCHVEQAQYGHRAQKNTWLYAVGCVLPELKWGHYLGDINYQVGRDKKRTNNKLILSCKEAKATPPAFRNTLISIARSCTRPWPSFEIKCK